MDFFLLNRKRKCLFYTISAGVLCSSLFVVSDDNLAFAQDSDKKYDIKARSILEIPEGYKSSTIFGISGDGATIIGSVQTNSHRDYSFYWKYNRDSKIASSPQPLLEPIKDIFVPESVLYGISGDGSVVVGETEAADDLKLAFLYRFKSEGSTEIAQKLLSNGRSGAYAVSYDGQTAVGYDTGGSLGLPVASYYVEGEDEKFKPLASLEEKYMSNALGVSGDGSVIAGWYLSKVGDINIRPFRWTEEERVQELPSLYNFAGSATAVSRDGKTIVGWLQDIARDREKQFYVPVRWLADKDGSQKVYPLSPLPVNKEGVQKPYAVSGDGSVIVGESFGQAFRWDAEAGMRAIADILKESKVNTEGWTLKVARGVSDDGRIIVGNGEYEVAGKKIQHSWLVVIDDLPVQPDPSVGRLPGVSPTPRLRVGLIAPKSYTRSVGTLSGLGFDGLSLGQVSLGSYEEVARHYDCASTQAGLKGVYPAVCPFITGSFSKGLDSPKTESFEGSVGLSVAVSPGFRVGFGGIASSSKGKTRETVLQSSYQTEAKSKGFGVGLFMAYEDVSGFEVYSTLVGQTLEGDMVRGYYNAATLEKVFGKPKGSFYGGTLRLAWAFPMQSNVKLKPFISYRGGRAHYNSYKERGGGIFAGDVSKQSLRLNEGRLGFEASYDVSKDLRLWGELAFVHSRRKGDAPYVTVSVLNDMVFGRGQKIKRNSNYGALSLGGRYTLMPNVALNGSLRFSKGKKRDAVSDIGAQLGISVGF